MSKATTICEVANVNLHLEFSAENNVIYCKLCFDGSKLNYIPSDQKIIWIISTHKVKEPLYESDALDITFKTLRRE